MSRYDYIKGSAPRRARSRVAQNKATTLKQRVDSTIQRVMSVVNAGGPVFRSDFKYEGAVTGRMDTTKPNKESYPSPGLQIPLSQHRKEVNDLKDKMRRLMKSNQRGEDFIKSMYENGTIETDFLKKSLADFIEYRISDFLKENIDVVNNYASVTPKADIIKHITQREYNQVTLAQMISVATVLGLNVSLTATKPVSDGSSDLGMTVGTGRTFVRYDVPKKDFGQYTINQNGNIKTDTRLTYYP